MDDFSSQSDQKQEPTVTIVQFESISLGPVFLWIYFLKPFKP